MAQIELPSVVALVEDVPGGTYASIALHADQLMRLHHEPCHQAA
jgi:hypothetical protein